MKNHSQSLSRLLPLLLGAALVPASDAQVTPGRTLYQITEGTYVLYGGFWGHLELKLPYPAQTFVALAVDAPASRAALTFLHEDRTTVFRTLTNGVVADSVVRFAYLMDHAVYPDVILPSQVDYVVTAQDQRLALDGAIWALDTPCCDIPYYFGHTNVVALALPQVVARVSEVELCWTAAADVAYQLQCRDLLDASPWTNLGEPIAGTGGTVCAARRLLPGEPSKYYRVLPVNPRRSSP